MRTVALALSFSEQGLSGDLADRRIHSSLVLNFVLQSRNMSKSS